jgi:hypothetical protein
MLGTLDTAGERLSIECAVPWVSELIAEGAAGEFQAPGLPGASVRVRVEADRRPFPTDDWRLLTRGVWHRAGAVVVANACTAGFDFHLRCSADEAEFVFRWRPPPRDRAAARVLRSRFHLLARAVLAQYPALWWAQVRDRAPLHVSACAGSSTVLLCSASGVGRSTLVLAELAAGGRATGDNLAVSDGTTVWGLVEPIRADGMGGRRMPHGRSEATLQRRADALVPESVVVVERGEGERPSLAPCSSEAAARSLVTSTYMAGELRRYWALAATLSAGTGRGPAHAPVDEVAATLTTALPCFVLELSAKPGAERASELLSSREAPAWA